VHEQRQQRRAHHDACRPCADAAEQAINDGIKHPASVMTPKKRMANTNIAATLAVVWMPGE
jgi:hypothetical protein